MVFTLKWSGGSRRGMLGRWRLLLWLKLYLLDDCFTIIYCIIINYAVYFSFIYFQWMFYFTIKITDKFNVKCRWKNPAVAAAQSVNNIYKLLNRSLSCWNKSKCGKFYQIIRLAKLSLQSKFVWNVLIHVFWFFFPIFFFWYWDIHCFFPFVVVMKFIYRISVLNTSFLLGLNIIIHWLQKFKLKED